MALLTPELTTRRDDVVLVRSNDETPFAILGYRVHRLGAYTASVVANEEMGATTIRYIHNPDTEYDGDVASASLEAFARFVHDHTRELGFPHTLIAAFLPGSTQQSGAFAKAHFIQAEGGPMIYEPQNTTAALAPETTTTES